MEKFLERNCIHGYHIYIIIKSMGGDGWRGVVCERDPKNSSDRYAVAVKNEGIIIVCSLFLRRGSTQSQV